jgi:hypothetical protein
MGWVWVHLVRRPITGLLYQPRMIDDECGVVGGMRIGNENRSTLRKPAPMPLCPPQTPHYLTWARSRAAAVGNRRLIAWVMAWPNYVWLKSDRVLLTIRLDDVLLIIQSNKTTRHIYISLLPLYEAPYIFCVPRVHTSLYTYILSERCRATQFCAPYMIRHNYIIDNDKPIKYLLKGKGLLPLVGLARLDS